MTQRTFFYPLVGLLTSGCVHMASISTTTIPADRESPVEAEAERFMFLLLNFDNNYVFRLTEDLAKQCPDGRVEGILTKQESIIYFPLIAHGVRVSAAGFCVKPALELETAEAGAGPEEVEPETPAEPRPSPGGEDNIDMPDADGDMQ